MLAENKLSNLVQVAFALLDKDGKCVAEFVDRNTDPSKWIKGEDTDYVSVVRPDNVPAGQYDFAVAIVDTSKEGNPPAIELSVDESIVTADGWSKISKVTLK